MISGPTKLQKPENVSFIPVERASEMESAVLRNLPKATAVIMAAAVSDFAPAAVHRAKIPKNDMSSINLKKTVDILKQTGKSKGKRFLIGFAAETGRNIDKAKIKLKEKNLDLIVLNDITQKGAGFDVDTNIVTIIDKKGKITDYPMMKKIEVANIILDIMPEVSKRGRK